MCFISSPLCLDEDEKMLHASLPAMLEGRKSQNVTSCIIWHMKMSAKPNMIAGVSLLIIAIAAGENQSRHAYGAHLAHRAAS